MDMILIAGLWLPNTAWEGVVDELERLGHRAVPVSLPGAGDGNATATLDDQVAAVLEAVDSSDRPLVVGHSAACTLAWIAADRRPDAVAAVALIGGFPGSDGSTYADFFDMVDGAMPFPGWEPFAGPDSDDLDDSDRTRFLADAIPVPEDVARGIVSLTDERRYQVPVVMVCPEYTPEQARAWVDAGDLPELERTDRVTYVDIDSGHWPMISQPNELANLLSQFAIDLG